MKWTPQQLSAIETKGSDILVSAAAGSGKTAVLTERIKRLVIDDGMSVDNMLVVTFSNAAASEMKEKIIKALNKAAAEDTAKASHLRAQIRKARTADISTFHKFSMGVIKRYFYLTEVEQNFSICDEGRRQIMIDEALDALIEERFEKSQEEDKAVAEGNQGVAKGMTFTKFLRDYCSVRNEDQLRSMILEVYKFIMSMPDPFEWLDWAVSGADVEAEEFKNSEICKRMADSLVKDIRRAYELYEGVCDMVAMIPSIHSKAVEDMAGVSAVLDAAESGSYNALFSALGMKFKTFTAAKDDKQDYAAIKDEVKYYRDKVKEIFKSALSNPLLNDFDAAVQRIRDTHPVALYLADMVKDFHQRFSAMKTEKNLLDFNDIEHIALGILRHEEIAAEYKKHFEVIFIDEYQDSSILQETLIGCISRGNNVYMVGDVKQSIYKFRLAEPEIFIDKYNDFREGRRPGIRIDLNRNFRSKGNILSAINGIFKNVMNRDTGGIDYDDDAALHKGSSYEGELDRKVSMYLIDSSKDMEDQDGEAIGDDNADAGYDGAEYEGDYGDQSGSFMDEEILDLKSAELEARVVAKLAAERIGMEIWDQKKECVRQVGIGDIVVLLRGTRGVSDIYAEALKDQGMPAYIDSGEGYFETSEIEVFMNLLKLIDNRRKDIPLISVLRSPIFGFSIDELVRIRLQHKKGSYNEAFLECAGRVSENESDSASALLTERCQAVCIKLDEWRMNARYMPLEEFLWKLMRETDYLDYVSALPGGQRRAANLKALVDKAVDFSKSQMKGLFGFINYVEALGNSQVSIGQAMQSGDTENMVRIMTIHKSKGLEFPVVILGGMGKKFNNDKNTSNVIMHKELGMALKYVDRDRRIFSKTVSQRVIADQKKKERLAEEMRILYVAMTRAMDELVMVGTVKDAAAMMEKYEMGFGNSPDAAIGFRDWVFPHLEEAGIELHMVSRKDLAAEKADDVTRIEDVRKEMEEGFPDFIDTEGYMDLIQQRFEFKYPYSDDVSSKSKFAVSELNRMLKEKPADVSAEGSAADLTENPLAQSLRQRVPAFMKEEEKITPMMRGTLVHKVLELIPFREDVSEADVREFVDSLVAQGRMEQKEADAVDVRKIVSFFDSEVGRRACRAPFLKKEWAFTLRKDREEMAAMAADSEISEMIRAELPEKLLIQGIIDCCFRDEDGLVIIDYKTDWVDRSNKVGAVNRFKEAYTNQLALYREVVEKALGEEVKSTMLFLIDSGDMVEM